MGRLRHEVGQRQKQEDSESTACGVVLDIIRMRKNKMHDGMSDSTFESVFIVFLTLKLTHVIDWSWWWVTAPIWGSFLIAVVVLLIMPLIKDKRRNIK